MEDFTIFYGRLYYILWKTLLYFTQTQIFIPLLKNENTHNINNINSIDKINTTYQKTK